MLRVTYLPIFTTGMLTVTLAITYTMCVSEKHCELVFPTISKTGRQRPESSVFSFGMNLAAWLCEWITITLVAAIGASSSQCFSLGNSFHPSQLTDWT